jgi:contractile injection system tube protein
MGIGTAGQTPARMSIANIATGQSVTAQFNPTEFEEALEVNWARQTVPGLSHQPLQFVNTGNTKFTLELNFEAQDPTRSLDEIHASRRFLLSLCYPRRGGDTVAGGGPPRALFVWPNVVSLTCVVTSLSFKYGRFNLEGTPVQFTAKVALEEIRDVRLLGEDVLREGTRRSGAASQGG